MKIDEKIKEVKSKLINILNMLIETGFDNKKEIIGRLKEVGLDESSAIELMVSFINAEKAKSESENVWKSSMNIRVENGNNIAEYQQREDESIQNFEELRSKCAVSIVLKTLSPNQINDETLATLYNLGIEEEVIGDPVLKIAFHYYSESKAKDIRREEELDKVKDYSQEIAGKMQNLTRRVQVLEEENKSLKSFNKTIKSAYERLKNMYYSRVNLDEKYYQIALTQIATLKDKLNQSQDISFFQKIKGLFKSRTKELPEPAEEIPDSLESVAKKIKIEKHEDITSDLVVNDKKSPQINRRESDEQWQQ